jgi:two-component system chemotaxis response regulator CheB
MCPFEVREAKDGDLVVPGLVLIAPGAKQMKLRPTAKEGARYEIQITDDEPVNRHKPSVDYLFNSVQDHVGANAVGVILTGMGNDGAKGLLKMKQRRARTIAQDEASSVVFGMPKEAISLGAADEVLSLNDIPAQLIRWLKTERSAA